MATLGLKEMGKFLWEVREKEGKGKGNWQGGKNNKIFCCWQWDCKSEKISDLS